MKGLGTTLGGNKCCKNICFSFLHLLHFIPPLHFGSFPILSSWFFSPPPVLFLPEEQHYPLLSLCTSFFFFFFLFYPPLFAYCSAPRRFPHVVGLLSLAEESCSRAPLQRVSSPLRVCLLPPLLYICCSRRGAGGEAGGGETRGSSAPRLHPGGTAWELQLAAPRAAAVEWSGV